MFIRFVTTRQHPDTGVQLGIFQTNLLLPSYGLSLDSPPQRPDSMNSRYVLVEATFDAAEAGHFGMWSGSLKKVVRLEPRGDSVPRRPTGFVELEQSDTARRVP